MPAFGGVLSAAQLDAVIAHVMELRRQARLELIAHLVVGLRGKRGS